MLGFSCLCYLGFCPHCSSFYFVPPEPERWKNYKTRRRYRRERRGRHRRHRLALHGQSRFFVEVLRWRLREAKSNAECDWIAQDEQLRWFGKRLPMPDWQWEFAYDNYFVWWPFAPGEEPDCPIPRGLVVRSWTGEWPPSRASATGSEEVPPAP